MIKTDVITILYDMPSGIKSFVRHNPDDTFTIILNSRLSYESQRERYKHEIRHLLSCDFEKSNADKIEAEAHRRTKRNE